MLGRADSWGYPPPGRLPDPVSSELFTSDMRLCAVVRGLVRCSCFMSPQKGCTFHALRGRCLLGGCLCASVGFSIAPLV